MGQEHSHHASGSQNDSANKASPAGVRRNTSSKSFRKPGQLLRGSTRKSQENEIPTVKKAKMPEGAIPTATDSQARDRLLSCPDFHHHTESEMVKRLEKLLSPKVQLEEAPYKVQNVKSSEQQAMKLFDGQNPPKITISNYLQRMVYYLGGIAENERNRGVDVNVHSDIAVRYILSAILYMERIQNRTGMVITLYNVHRLLITGILIAAKILDDFQPNQKYFADLGGVSTLELARLEVAFLQLCDYNVNVDPEIFAAKYATALLERERVFSDVSEALALGAIASPRMPARTLVI